VAALLSLRGELWPQGDAIRAVQEVLAYYLAYQNNELPLRIQQTLRDHFGIYPCYSASDALAQITRLGGTGHSVAQANPVVGRGPPRAPPRVQTSSGEGKGSSKASKKDKSKVKRSKCPTCGQPWKDRKKEPDSDEDDPSQGQPSVNVNVHFKVRDPVEVSETVPLVK
jgi:hypothetical protein